MLAVTLASYANPPSDSASGFDGAMTPDGRYTAFVSTGPNLAPGDTSFTSDVFRYDRLTGEIIPISVNVSGTGLRDDFSIAPQISDDGNLIAFYSESSNLVASDSNGVTDIYLRNVSAGTTTLVSQNLAGTDAGNNRSTSPLISGDGSTLIYSSAASDLVATDGDGGSFDVFRYDIATGTNSLVTWSISGATSANGSSFAAAISGNGDTVLISSTSTNLHPIATNGQQQAYAYELSIGTFELLSYNQSETNGGNHRSAGLSVSHDGSVVVFESLASDLEPQDADSSQDTFVINRITGDRTFISGPGTGTLSVQGSTLSSDGSAAAFINWDAGERQAYWYDVATGTTELISVSLTGGNGDDDTSSVRLSPDGRTAYFSSSARNLHLLDTDFSSGIDVYRRDMVGGTTDLISFNQAGDAASRGNAVLLDVSDDGQFILFYGEGDDMVAGDTNDARDVFIRNLSAGSTTLVSRRDPSLPERSSNGDSRLYDMTPDGRYLLILSDATNMTPEPATGADSLFRYDRLTDELVLVSIDRDGVAADAFRGRMSADGNRVSFASRSTNIVAGDTNNEADILLRDISAGTTTLVSRTPAGTPGNSRSCESSISADGNRIAFESDSDDLVPSDLNNARDVFVFDVSTNLVQLISVNSAGTGSGNSQALSQPVEITRDGS